MIVDAFLMRGFHREFSLSAFAFCNVDDKALGEFLAEDARVAKERRELRNNLRALDAAEKILHEIA